MQEMMAEGGDILAGGLCPSFVTRGCWKRVCNPIKILLHYKCITTNPSLQTRGSGGVAPELSRINTKSDYLYTNNFLHMPNKKNNWI